MTPQAVVVLGFVVLLLVALTALLWRHDRLTRELLAKREVLDAVGRINHAAWQARRELTELAMQARERDV